LGEAPGPRRSPEVAEAGVARLPVGSDAQCLQHQPHLHYISTSYDASAHIMPIYIPLLGLAFSNCASLKASDLSFDTPWRHSFPQMCYVDTAVAITTISHETTKPIYDRKAPIDILSGRSQPFSCSLLALGRIAHAI